MRGWKWEDEIVVCRVGKQTLAKRGLRNGARVRAMCTIGPTFSHTHTHMLFIYFKFKFLIYFFFPQLIITCWAIWEIWMLYYLVYRVDSVCSDLPSLYLLVVFFICTYLKTPSNLDARVCNFIYAVIIRKKHLAATAKRPHTLKLFICNVYATHV